MKELKETLSSFYLLIAIKETFSITTISKVFILFSDDQVFSSEVTPLILFITTVIKFSEHLRKYETFYVTLQTSLEFFSIATHCKRGQLKVNIFRALFLRLRDFFQQFKLKGLAGISEKRHSLNYLDEWVIVPQYYLFTTGPLS